MTNSTNTVSEPKFSIITPTCNRPDQLERACKSVEAQTYENWEHIIVDDMTNVKMQVADGEVDYNIELLVGQIHKLGNWQYIRHNKRTERIISYNDGMKAVKNDWVLFLDDDDEILPFTLEYLAEAIKTYPDFKVFNYGGLVTAKNKYWMRVREPIQFEQKLNPVNVVSGQVVNGQFIFHKSCLEKTGLFPEAHNCYELADMAGIPGYSSKVRTLGNPWGNDFLMFWRLTRHYISKKLDYYLYITHLRTTE